MPPKRKGSNMPPKRKRERFKINYTEGDVFVFPLESGDFARGVVARMDGRGAILGYFFGPRLKNVSDAIVNEDIVARNAIRIQFFGDLGLVVDWWQVIGKVTPWNRHEWPMPVFGFAHLLIEGRGELRYYDEDTLQWISKKDVDIEDVKGLPEDGLGNMGYVEAKIDSILHGVSKRFETT